MPKLETWKKWDIEDKIAQAQAIRKEGKDILDKFVNDGRGFCRRDHGGRLIYTKYKHTIDLLTHDMRRDLGNMKFYIESMQMGRLWCSMMGVYNKMLLLKLLMELLDQMIEWRLTANDTT